LTACMTPDSLSILLARDPDAIATEARRPPPRAVVAPFNLPKVIVQTECDETATLPLGVKARVSTPAPSPPRPAPTLARSLRARLARLSASLCMAGGAALVVAIPSPVAHGASTVRVVQVMANAGHAAAGWAGAVRALVWR
jgi:hypothetical protein